MGFLLFMSYVWKKDTVLLFLIVRANTTTHKQMTDQKERHLYRLSLKFGHIENMINCIFFYLHRLYIVLSKEKKNWLLCLGHAKGEDVLNANHINATYLIECIKRECARIGGDLELLHRVTRINLCITYWRCYLLILKFNKLLKI